MFSGLENLQNLNLEGNGIKVRSDCEENDFRQKMNSLENVTEKSFWRKGYTNCSF